MNNHHTPGGGDLPMYPENASSDQIRWDIEKTKAEMDETIEALSCQLKPKQLLSDLTAAIKEKVTGRAADGTQTGSGAGLRAAGLVLGGTIGTKIGIKLVRHMACHPVSSALIGSGVAWMILESSEQTSIMRRLRMAMAKPMNVPDPTNMYGQPAAGPGCATSQWKGAAASGPGMVEKVKEKAAGLGEKVSDTVGGLGEKVSGLGSSIKNRIAGLTSSEPQAGPGPVCNTGMGSSGSGELGMPRPTTASEMGSPGGSRIKDMTDSAKSKLEDARHTIGDVTGTVKDKLNEVADTVREKISHAGQAAGESLHQVGSSVSSTAAGLTHRVREGASHLGSNIRGGSSRVGDFIDENPLLAGGVVMGLGLLAGLLVPESEQGAD